MSNVRDLFKSNILALVAAGIVIVVFSFPPFGFLALCVFPLIWSLWLPYCFYVLLKKPAKRRTQLFRITVWLSAAILIACAHWGWHLMVRHRADSVVSKIVMFQSSHHRYPSSLSEIGINEQESYKRFGSVAYFVSDDGKPSLLYPDTFRPFSAFDYDFDKHKWKYLSDK